MNETKLCIHCGKELPKEASFCPACAKSQIEKETVRFPGIKKRKILRFLLIPAALLIIVLAAVLWKKPRTYEADGAELVYKANGVSWHLLLRNDQVDFLHWTSPQPLYTRTLVNGTQAAIPLQLYVYREDTGENAREEFAELLENSTVAVTADPGSESASPSVPAWNPGFPDAMLEADIVYDTACSSNDIFWTLNMKNGDTLILREEMEIHIRPEANYSYKNTPLETMEDLRALIEKAEREVSKDAIVTITLAPVVYEGDLVIENRAISLIGTEDGNARTTFTGTLYIRSEEPQHLAVNTIHFAGDGSGRGIEATSSFEAEACSFEGLEIGIFGDDGSSPILSGCRFENCGTGVLIDSSSSILRAAFIHESVFIANKTAVLLEHLPFDDVFYFISCTFTDNETDVENHAGNQIEYMNSGG
ncbi:MAG: hypothetical protein IJL47_06505 [Lachnospiraceae bacterium]|nr:hypothetical protein [Lachnospiraceae bacterium]MBQ6197167.1 hypothetical protein [Lachnospiraceae bacterium]